MSAWFVGFAILFPWNNALPSDRAEEMIRRSVANTTAVWNAAPRYDFTERDIVVRHGKRSTKTFRVMSQQILSELSRATTAYYEATPDRVDEARQEYEEAVRRFKRRFTEHS